MHENIEKALTLPSALMMNPDPYVGDAYLLIIVQEYLRRYHEGGKVDKKLVWDSCILLERLLDFSPSNQHIRLVLIVLYVWELGAWDAGNDLFKPLDIKHIQCETVGYVLSRWGSDVGGIDDAIGNLNSAIQFKFQSVDDAREQIIQAFRGGVFDKVIEMMDYVKKLENSGYARYAEIESMFLESMYEQKNLSAVRRDEMTSEDKSFLNYKTPVSELVDNRDLGLFDDWQENAVERTRFCQTNNYEELKAWMSFREAYANCFLKIETADDSEPVPDLTSLVTKALSALSDGEKYKQYNVTPPKDVPLRLDTEWKSVDAVHFEQSLPATVDLVKALKFIKSEDVGQSIEKMSEIVKTIVEPLLKGTDAFYSVDSKSDAFYSHPSKIGSIRLVLELLSQIVLALKPISLSSKTLKKLSASKKSPLHSNLEKLTAFVALLESTLTVFLENLPKIEISALEKCEKFDADYAERTVRHRMSTNLSNNVRRYSELVKSMLKNISKIKL